MIYEAMDIAEERATHTMKKKEYSDDDIRNQYVDYAYLLGGEDLVYLIECENAIWTLDRQSSVVKNWHREESYWVCQIHRPDHKDIVWNPNPFKCNEKDKKKNCDEQYKEWEVGHNQWIKFSTDYKYQIEQCNNLMKWWTPFFWRDRKVKWMKCSDYVKPRFILEQDTDE